MGFRRTKKMKHGKSRGGAGSGNNTPRRIRSHSHSPSPSPPPVLYKGVFEPVIERNDAPLSDTDPRLREQDYQFITKVLTRNIINHMQMLSIKKGTGLDKKPFYSVNFRPGGSFFAYSNFPMEITVDLLPINKTFSRGRNTYKLVGWIDLSD